METKTVLARPYLKELKVIENELSEIWKLLSPAEKQKRAIFQKMNRVRITLHRLIYSHDLGNKSQAQCEPKINGDSDSQKNYTKRD